MDAHAHVIRLIERYAAARQIAVTSACVYAASQARLVDRLRAGRDITTRRAERIIQWLSNHWPADAEWPPDIPRPAPAAPPEAAGPAPPVASLREATAAARGRKLAAMDAGDWKAAERHEQAMFSAALTLDDRGQIADPGALCLALGVPRYIYDDVVRRYAGHPERRPRPTTRTARMVRALRLSGDRRFTAAPWPREAA